jgi:hypothetical protein
MEILFLDALAVHLMGPDRPLPPYTVGHGTVVVGHLLRAVTDSALLTLEVCPGETPEITEARAAISAGAGAFAQRGGLGVQQLVSRFLAAAVGELEIHRESAEAQTRSVFHYGLLAVASGPGNRLTPAAGDGVGAIFRGWDALIGAGFVPPWRVLA